MLDTSMDLDNALVTSLLAVGQLLVGVPLALNLVPESVLSKLSFTRFRRIVAVGVNVPACVAGIEEGISTGC